MSNKRPRDLTTLPSISDSDILVVEDMSEATTTEVRQDTLGDLLDHGNDRTSTLTNKTITVDDNTIDQAAPSAGQYLRDNGTKFIGAQLQVADLDTDPLSRANHTGAQAHTTISDFDTGVQANRLDQMAVPTATVDFNSQTIDNVGTLLTDTSLPAQSGKIRLASSDTIAWRDPADILDVALSVSGSFNKNLLWNGTTLLDASNTITVSGKSFREGSTWIVDNIDDTKKFKFALATGHPSSTVYTATLPDSNVDIIGKDTTDTLTNKTITDSSNAVDIGTFVIASEANGDMIHRNGSGTWTRLPIGANGQVLKVSSSLPSWEDEGGGSSHALLSATHTDSTTDTVARGDLIVGDATPEWAALAIGSANTVLKSDGTDASWGSIVNADISASAGIAVSKLADGDAYQRIRTDAAGTGVEYFTEQAGIPFVIDGGGAVIETGIKGDIEIPFDCVIKSVRMFADQSGSIAVDIWKDTYANYPATDADSITASAVPTVSGATKSEDTTLTGWATTLAKGDILRYNVDSVTSIQRVTLSLIVDKRG